MRQLVVAHSLERAIGEGNQLPWGRDMPRDLARFRELTLKHAVIMGRKTFESIGRPLPGRENIVLSTRPTSIEGCRVVSTLEEGFRVGAEYSEDSFVIGGTSVYRIALPHVEKLHVTEIDESFPNSDTFFPEIDPSIWRLDSRSFLLKDDKNKYDCWFSEYSKVVGR